MFVLFFRSPHSLATSSALRSLNSPSLEVQQIRCSCFWSSSNCNRNCHSVIALSIPGEEGAGQSSSARQAWGRGCGGAWAPLSPSLPIPEPDKVIFTSIPTGYTQSRALWLHFGNLYNSKELQGSPVVLVFTTHMPLGDRVAMEIK